MVFGRERRPVPRQPTVGAAAAASRPPLDAPAHAHGGQWGHEKPSRPHGCAADADADARAGGTTEASVQPPVTTADGGGTPAMAAPTVATATTSTTTLPSASTAPSRRKTFAVWYAGRREVFSISQGDTGADISRTVGQAWGIPSDAAAFGLKQRVAPGVTAAGDMAGMEAPAADEDAPNVVLGWPSLDDGGAYTLHVCEPLLWAAPAAASGRDLPQPHHHHHSPLLPPPTSTFAAAHGAEPQPEHDSGAIGVGVAAVGPNASAAASAASLMNPEDGSFHTVLSQTQRSLGPAPQQGLAGGRLSTASVELRDPSAVFGRARALRMGVPDGVPMDVSRLSVAESVGSAATTPVDAAAASTLPGSNASVSLAGDRGSPSLLHSTPHIPVDLSTQTIDASLPTLSATAHRGSTAAIRRAGSPDRRSITSLVSDAASASGSGIAGAVASEAAAAGDVSMRSGLDASSSSFGGGRVSASGEGPPAARGGRVGFDVSHGSIDGSGVTGEVDSMSASASAAMLGAAAPTSPVGNTASSAGGGDDSTALTGILRQRRRSDVSVVNASGATLDRDRRVSSRRTSSAQRRGSSAAYHRRRGATVWYAVLVITLVALAVLGLFAVRGNTRGAAAALRTPHGTHQGGADPTSPHEGNSHVDVVGASAADDEYVEYIETPLTPHTAPPPAHTPLPAYWTSSDGGHYVRYVDVRGVVVDAAIPLGVTALADAAGSQVERTVDGEVLLLVEAEGETQ